ncbi:hypothetical protein HU200_041869 [Digitaria exilis]|uniref:Uncharacterized protein n=1 Tax=Digitaria exilis TaxID=1010633 RepID=A0A835BEP9_9POAL|nr:hypothetical protein HU200_041869 [Digitaria exilis]
MIPITVLPNPRIWRSLGPKAEAALERPGETLLSPLVGALIAFKPPYSLMKLASREIIISPQPDPTPPILQFPTIIRRGEKSSDQPMASVECQHGKRKADSSTGEECSLNDERATKRIDCSEGDREKGAAAAVAGIDCSDREKGAAAPPPPKKMWRLPREEVHWILAHSSEPVCARIRDLKRANPSLVPSPEEEKDPSTVLLYTCARIMYEEGEKFAKFQAWVRGEYASKGFVEVDYDYFGRRAEAIRRSNKARDEVFKDYDLSSDNEDDYAGKLIKRTVRSFF